MCGICGYYVFHGPASADPRVLKSMTDTLRHRGPDDEGMFVQSKVALGMRRLSIIDVAQGHQPICNEDGTVWVILNGEIYNFQQLREELLNKGHKFKTASDTEVIVHLYEEKGERLLQELDGMFAFCIWDKSQKKLLLARDPSGKKPLHYAVIDGQLIFGSEIKAILSHPAISRRLDPVSLQKYLAYGYVPAPRTIFHGISKLPGGHFATIGANGSMKIESYWEFPRSVLRRRPESELVQESETILNAAVKKRLVSDVPLGVFLSGGIDSSLVAAFARNNWPGSHDLDAFSIGFSEADHNEVPYAQAVAKHLGLKHHFEIVPARRCLDMIQDVINYVDEPMGDPSILPTFLLSAFTRRYVTVALSGDGGDELFAGYPKYLAHRALHGVPANLRRALSPSFSWLSKTFFPSNDRLARIACNMAQSPELQNQLWITPFVNGIQNHILAPEWQCTTDGEENVWEEVLHLSKGKPDVDVVSKMFYLDFTLTLQDLYLVKVDRASMASSLEVRCPFLDRRLIEFAARIPTHQKLSGFRTKYLLKKLAEQYLPKDVIWRRKMGFGIPLAQWLRTDLAPLVQQYLNRERLEREGIFNFEVVQQVVKEHLQSYRNHAAAIWTLLTFCFWQEKWAA
jgi:asparagine synthase (glutamine-hydrolysing)